MRLLCTATVVLAALASAQGPWPSPPHWTELDRTLLTSTDIVVGELGRSAADDLRRAAARGGGYVRVPIQVDRVLLAGDDKPVDELTFFAARPTHAFAFHPSEPELRRQLGQQRVLLLRRVGERAFLADRFHNTSILMPEAAPAVKLRAELHERLGETPLPTEDVPLRARVDELCDGLVAGGDDAHAAWNALSGLPPTALLALIGKLTDRRPLTSLKLPVVGAGGPGLRWVVPHRVRDAIHELLRIRTTERFGPVGRWPNETEWPGVLRTWRIYAHLVMVGKVVAKERP